MATLTGVNSFRSGLQIAARGLSRSLVGHTRRSVAASYHSAAHPSDDHASKRACLRRPQPSWTQSAPRIEGLRTFKILPGSVITQHYVDLPPNYTDEVGIPFRRTDLTAEEVVALFGPKMSTLAGNKLLRILHGRRVAGTLDDPEVLINTKHFPRKQQDIALEYLRRTINVDEISNAGLRAEDELAALEGTSNEAEEDGDGTKKDGSPGYASRFKLFKDSPQTQEDIYGVGAFDKVRAANKARWEEELKRREEEKKRREEEEANSNPGGLAKIDPDQPRQPTAAMQTYLAAGQSDLKEPPKMAKWERLLPSTILVLLTTGVWVAYAHLYQAPLRQDRLYPDIPPAAATVGALILANTLVYCLWKVPALWPFLNRHFILTSATPRVSAILGAMFSHQAASHLLTNMLVLWLFGTRLHDEVGRGSFLAVYFGTGAVGFLGTLYSLVLRNMLSVSTLGASGAVFGTLSAYLWIHRFDSMKVFGLPPDPYNGVQGMGILALLVAMHIPLMFSKSKQNKDLASHLTGIASGILAGHFLEKKLEKGRQLPRQEPIAIASSDEAVESSPRA